MRELSVILFVEKASTTVANYVVEMPNISFQSCSPLLAALTKMDTRSFDNVAASDHPLLGMDLVTEKT